jgi:hypothetical protein
VVSGEWGVARHVAFSFRTDRVGGPGRLPAVSAVGSRSAVSAAGARSAGDELLHAAYAATVTELI